MSFQFSLFWVDSEEITAAVVWDLSFTMTVFYTHSMSVYIAICALSECSNLLTHLLNFTYEEEFTDPKESPPYCGDYIRLSISSDLGTL